jgi:hypothetical protein
MAICKLVLDNGNDPTREIRRHINCMADQSAYDSDLEEHLFSRRYVPYADRLNRCAWVVYPGYSPAPRSGTEMVVFFLTPTSRKVLRKTRIYNRRNQIRVYLTAKRWMNDPFLRDLHTWVTGDLPTYQFTLTPKDKINAMLDNRCRRHRNQTNPAC